MMGEITNKKNYLIILWNVCMSKKIVKACNETRCMSEISQDKMLMFWVY